MGSHSEVSYNRRSSPGSVGSFSAERARLATVFGPPDADDLSTLALVLPWMILDVERAALGLQILADAIDRTGGLVTRPN
jgi:hypothetical protein